MVNQELVGGLSSAVSRGVSLEKSMQSFYQAGYKREEIEEAAAFVQNQNIEPVKSSVDKEISQVKPLSKKAKSQVSSYDLESKKTIDNKKIILIIILIIVFALLIGALILAFIFKDKITGLF